MLGSFRNRRAGVLIWALLVALVVGLAGFGIGAGRGISSQNVAKVGSRPVTADEYVRAMQQELRALNQQLGRDLPISEARQYGVDGMVLARLVNDAALDNEAARLGVSTGDATVLSQVTATPAFHGADGKFDRATYTDALERAGLRPNQFEALLRGEATRNLLAGGVQAAATMPDTAALTVLAFLGEQRGFDWIRLDASLLPTPIPAPTDAELATEHKDQRRPLHPARDPRDQLREHHPRGARPRDRDPRGRAPRRLRRQRRYLPDPGAPGARPHRLPDHRGGRGRQGPPRRRRDRLRRAGHRARAEARGHRPGHRRRRHAAGRGARRGLRCQRRPRRGRPAADAARPGALPDQCDHVGADHAVRGGQGRSRQEPPARRGQESRSPRTPRISRI